MQSALELVSATIAAKGGGRAEFWIHGVDDNRDLGPTGAGFVAYRDLWQVRMALPAAPSNLDVRPFRVDDDEDVERFIDINNRAFAWHPEQGGLTRRDVEATMGEPWFQAEGFLLHEVGDELAGFCWTKIHPAGADDPADPALGEIYVIALNPDFHGQGLGGPMTLAGLEWLAAQGLDTAMLYVESDNHAANAVYRKLGFTHHRTSRAYERQIDAL